MQFSPRQGARLRICIWLLVGLFLAMAAGSRVLQSRMSSRRDMTPLQQLLATYNHYDRTGLLADPRLASDAVAIGRKLVEMATSPTQKEAASTRYWAALAVLTQPAFDTRDRCRAGEFLASNYSNYDHLFAVVLSLQATDPRSAAEILRVFLRSPSERLQIAAGYALANVLADQPECQPGSRAMQEALALLEDVRVRGSAYRNPVYTDYTMAELADGKIRELTLLRPGDTAPDIEGLDLEGKPLRLSDYRGSVVVLYFWGGW